MVHSLPNSPFLSRWGIQRNVPELGLTKVDWANMATVAFLVRCGHFVVRSRTDILFPPSGRKAREARVVRQVSAGGHVYG